MNVEVTVSDDRELVTVRISKTLAYGEATVIRSEEIEFSFKTAKLVHEALGRELSTSFASVIPDGKTAHQ